MIHPPLLKFSTASLNTTFNIRSSKMALPRVINTITNTTFYISLAPSELFKCKCTSLNENVWRGKVCMRHHNFFHLVCIHGPGKSVTVKICITSYSQCEHCYWHLVGGSWFLWENLRKKYHKCYNTCSHMCFLNIN